MKEEEKKTNERKRKFCIWNKKKWDKKSRNIPASQMNKQAKWMKTNNGRSNKSVFTFFSVRDHHVWF